MKKVAHIIGSGASSIANFAFLLSVQSTEDPTNFAIMAFLQIVLFFGQSFVGALTGAPLLMLLGKKGVIREISIYSSFFCISFLVSIFISLLILTISNASHGDYLFSVTIALSAIVSIVRIYCRMFDISRGVKSSAGTSDLIFGIALIFFTALVHLLSPSMIFYAIAYAVAQLFGFVYIYKCVNLPLRLRKSSWKLTLASIRKYGMWSGLGVVTTELMVNAHSYVVVSVSGPDSFALLALLSTLFRPLSVVTVTLAQYERPRLVQMFRKGEFSLLSKYCRKLKIISIAIWMVNVLACAIFILGYNNLNPNYDIFASLIIFSSIRLFSSIRSIDSLSIQAQGEFRYITVLTSSFAPLVLLLCFIGIIVTPEYPSSALFGVLFGEIILLAFMHKRARCNEKLSS